MTSLQPLPRFTLQNGAGLMQFEEAHAPDLFALMDRNRQHLRQWLPWLDANTSPQDTLRFIRAGLDSLAHNKGFDMGLWRNGRIAGVVSVKALDWSNRKAQLGYWISAESQGLGLVTQACSALISHAFARLGLNRVEIHCATENLRSRAIPERLGFALEGELRQAEWLYDHYVDHAVYGMLSGDWDGAGKAA